MRPASGSRSRSVSAARLPSPATRSIRCCSVPTTRSTRRRTGVGTGWSPRTATRRRRWRSPPEQEFRHSGIVQRTRPGTYARGLIKIFSSDGGLLSSMIEPRARWWRRWLLDLRFLEDHVLARDRVEFLQFELVGLGPRVLFRHVEVAGVGAADELDLDG